MATEDYMKLEKERDALMLAQAKLHRFVNTRPYHQLTDNEQNLLSMQLGVMNQYINIIEMRMSAFVEGKSTCVPH